MPRQIIAREAEKHFLREFYNSDQPEFLAIYGRRRVGKTYLIRSFFADKSDIVFFDVTGLQKGSMAEQIANFTKEIANTFLYSGARLEMGKNWREAFSTLTDNIKNTPQNKKIVLFFDEFPWMVTKNSRLLTNLEYYWNQHWSKDNRVKLIICGSSAGWILRNIINNEKGLYNRTTRTIALEPFNLAETKEFLEYRKVKLNDKQIAEIFMYLGGIPHYLNQIDKGLTATEAIELLAFRKNSFLLQEFDRLYSTLFNDGQKYINLVRLIAQHRHGIGQEALLEQAEKISSGGGVVEKLQDLEDAGFIINFRPHFNKKKGIFYKVIDEYTLFYFSWIEPIKASLLAKGLRKGYWQQTKLKPAWRTWSGYAFESLCYKHLSQIGNALELSPTAIPDTWRYVASTKRVKEQQGAQIDLLFDRDDDAITICEIKYTEQSFGIDKEYANKLLNKLQIFKNKTRTKKQLFVAMIAANGIKPTMYSEELVTRVVTLKDLFNKE